MRPIRDIKNQRFSRLTAKKIIRRNSRGSIVWLFQCICGKYIERVGTDVTRNNSKIRSCGCLLKEVAKRKLININNKSGNQHPQFNGYKNLAGYYLSSIRCRARKLNIEYNVSKEFLWNLFERQNRKCNISGVEITLCDSIKNKKTNKMLQTASLDRIDSTRGYTKDNVQWLHKVVNKMKLNMTDNEFIEWCKLITKNKNIL